MKDNPNPEESAATIDVEEDILTIKGSMEIATAIARKADTIAEAARQTADKMHNVILELKLLEQNNERLPIAKLRTRRDEILGNITISNLTLRVIERRLDDVIGQNVTENPPTPALKVFDGDGDESQKK